MVNNQKLSWDHKTKLSKNVKHKNVSLTDEKPQYDLNLSDKKSQTIEKKLQQSVKKTQNFKKTCIKIH